jgi:anti-anti-sigma factor
MSYDSRWTGPLSIRHDSVMGIQVLAFDGALDADTGDRARRTMTTALERAAPLVLDLRLLRAVDAAGVALIHSSLRRLHEAGVPAAVVRPDAGDVARLVGGTRPDDLIRLQDGLSAAIEAVSPAWTSASTRWTPERSVPIRPRRPPGS